MPEKKAFVPVDDLMPKVSLEQAAAFYHVELPELKQINSEIRSRCFLNCGKVSGERALAIQADHPAKQWKCHQAGCGKAGNLVSMIDLLKPGENSGGKPRGDRFKAIAADLAAMVAGVVRGVDVQPPAKHKAPPEPKINVPLAKSENERAAALVELDRKFVRDVAAMPPNASAYVRRRPFLTADAMEIWRVGYLPRDAGEDRSGGTMRGRMVYPYISESGELLTWFGRDVEFEEKHNEWVKAHGQEQEPERYRFVKGFHHIELWGQHRFREEGIGAKLNGLGLLLVGSPNDVIRLEALGVPAVALCGTIISRAQAEKAARLATAHAGGIVTLFFSCDAEGIAGMRQCLDYIAQLGSVRLAWTDKMFGGKFRGRRPSNLMPDEWQELAAYLRAGERRNWSFA